MGSCMGLANSLSFGDSGRSSLQIIICDLGLTFLSLSLWASADYKGHDSSHTIQSLLWNGDKHVFNRQEFKKKLKTLSSGDI